LSSKHDDGWTVLAGGALALAVVTAIGVVGGRMLSELLSRRRLLWLSAVAFVTMGILIGLGVL
ncbi:MAG: TMEM165/GDT1 family protein, partial [Anaerolineae bacterium]|jgi:putative Ca2+/H+ antiporter (TMEM165/GDT1 family)